MPQQITQIALLVRDYDEAISFYISKLGFTLIEDTDLGNAKRWIRIRPPGSNGAELLLARAVTPEQQSRVGNQTGGRVFLFFETDNFDRDYAAMKARGVTFLGDPRQEPYGTVIVFQDLYANKFDLIQPAQRPAPTPPTSPPSSAE